MNVWTLTVDGDYEVTTSVHRSEDDAYNQLFAEYDPSGHVYRGDLQKLLDGEGLVVKVEEHHLEYMYPWDEV